jgi:hypothetical protein
MMIAYGRIFLYSAIAYGMWKRKKGIAYVAAGAAGLSLLSSLSAEAMAKKQVASNTAPDNVVAFTPSNPPEKVHTGAVREF